MRFYVPFGSRKLVFAAVVILLCCLGVVLIFIQRKQTRQQRVRVAFTAPTLVPEPTRSVTPPALYTIHFPPGWTPVTLPAEGRESYLMIKPATIATGEAFPGMEIQVYPARDTSVAKKVDDLSPLNLQQTNITFQGNPAVQLSGVLPLYFLTGDPLHKPVFKTYILFQKGLRVYIVDYAYYQDKDAAKYQQLFSQLLTTFTLNY